MEDTIKLFSSRPAYERLTEPQMKQLRGLAALFDIQFEKASEDTYRIIPFDGAQKWIELPTRKAHARLLAELCHIVGEKIVFSMKQNIEDTLLALQPKTLAGYAKAHKDFKESLKQQQIQVVAAYQQAL